MSNGAIGWRRARRGALALAAALVCGPAPASAPDGRSSPEDRGRFVAVTRSLEQAPLDPGLKAEREWALAWLTEAPDVTVTICPKALGNLVSSHYPYASEILFQDMFSMAALVIEHPEKTDDPDAQQLAGVEGALNAYRSILKEKPEVKSPALDGLLQAQSRGELPDLTRKARIRCSAKK
jgi:hypothetical protein